jgi:hypothetical protein
MADDDDDLAPMVRASGGSALSRMRDRLKANEAAAAIPREIATAAAGSAFPGQDTARRIARGLTRTVSDVPKAAAVAARAGDKAGMETGDFLTERWSADLAEAKRVMDDPEATPGRRAAAETAAAELTELIERTARARGASTEALQTPVKETALFKAGTAVDEAVESVVGKPETSRDADFTAQLAEGAGSMAGFMLSGIATRGAGPLIQGVAMGAVGQFENALAKGADEATALQAAGLGGLIGTTEVLPLMRALRPLGNKIRGKVVQAIAARVAMSSAEEAAQEAIQGVLENMVARGFYDPEKGVFDGVGTQALIGAILGGGVGFVGGIASPTIDTGRPPGDAERAEVATEATRLAAEAEVRRNDPIDDPVSDADIGLGDPDGELTTTAESAEAAIEADRAILEGRGRFETAIEAVGRELERVRAELAAFDGDGTSVGDPMLDLISRAEGTAFKDGYNVTLGYGVFTDGPTNLTEMTLDEIDALQTRMLRHPGNTFNSSAVGRYQIVQKTLRWLRGQMKLSGGERYSPELQDRLAKYLLKHRGRSPAALRSEWQGLVTRSDGAILAAFDGAPLPARDDGRTMSPTRAGTLRRRVGRLGEAMARAIENTSREGAEAIGRAADALTRAGERVRLDDLEAIVRKIMERPEVPASVAETLRAIQKGERVGAARPLDRMLRSLGGIKIGSDADTLLRDAGISPQTHPGLFKKDGGVADLSEIDREGQELLNTHPQLVSEDGRIDPDQLVAALTDEVSGKRLLTGDELAREAEIQNFSEMLRDLGIDADTATAEGVHAAIVEADARLKDEEARRDVLDGTPAHEADPLDVSPDLQEDVTGHLDAPAAESDPRATPADPDAPAGKVYINHARIKTGEDVKELLQRFADEDAAHIDEKRRGVVSNQRTLRASDAEYRNLEDLLGRKPGPMTAAEATAARRLLTTSGEQLIRLAKIAAKPGATAAEMAAFRRASQVHYAIQAEVIAARTETARALQAWSIPATADKARAAHLRALIDAEGGTDNIKRMALHVASLEGNDTGLNVYMRETLGGRVGKAAYEVWINGLLSGPKTHVVNITSNAMTAFWAVPERALAAAISQTLYEGDVKAGEVSAMLYGMSAGVRDGLHIALGTRWADQKLGEAIGYETKREPGEIQRHFSATALGVDPASSFGYGIDLLGKAIGIPTHLLGREDAFFKAVGYRMQLRAHAYREAVNEGLRGREAAERVAEILRDPPEHINASAFDFAAYQTFTNELGELGRAGTRMINRIPGGRIIIPFIRTPTNIMKYTLQRTPFALASKAIRADIRAGGQRGAVALARISMGTTMMTLVANYAMEGMITGGGPEDPDLRRAWMADGNLPYAVKIGDRWFSYNRLDPIGMLMGIAADIAEVANDASDPDVPAELVTAGFFAIKDNLLSKTYLRGLTEFLGMLDGRNPMHTPSDWVGNLAASGMPFSTLLRQSAQAKDPVIRDARAYDRGKFSAGEFFDEMVRKWKATIPGLSADLPPRRNLWGEELTRESGLGTAFDFVSPVTSRKQKNDPVNKAFIENAVEVSMPRRVIQGAPLTPEEYDDYVRLAGVRAKALLDELVTRPSFKALGDGRDSLKSEMMRSIVLETRRAAAAEMLRLHPDLRARILKAKREEAQRLRGRVTEEATDGG